MSDPNTTRVTSPSALSSAPSATVVSPRSSDSGSEGTQAQTEPPRQLFQPPGMPVVPGFVVMREIARGGMGTVFAAHDPAFDREVAVKIMHSGQDGDRFIVESKITAQLPHPGIPPVYTLGTLPDGRPFLAMKLIAGRTLGEELRSAKRTDLPRLLSIFEQICQTVGFAHNRGIMHRDLKPANIMVGAFGEVLVMDWGLAREVRNGEQGASTEGRSEPPTLDAIFTDRRAANDESTPVDEPPSVPHSNGSAVRRIAETVSGQVKGTPAYMAPEQARGEQVDARADVFALGGILSVILTGRPPFQGDTALNTVVKAALADMAECFAKLDACGADPDLIAIAKKCLAANSADRYANGEKLATAVSAHRGSVEQRLRQAERDRAVSEAEVREQRKRRRVQLALAAVIGLALATGGGLAWYSDRQESARKQKEQLDEADRKFQHERDENARKELERDRDRKVKQARAGIAAGLKIEPALRKQYKFAEAAAALQQVSDLTQSAPELRDAVQQARDNLAFVVQLDDIRFRKWVWISLKGRNGHFNTEIASPEYRKAFAARGYNVLSLDPEEIAKQLATSAIKAELVAALDDWALYEPDESLRNRLLEIAKKIDPGAWTNRLRDPTAWKNKTALRQLAVDADPATTSPADISVLAELMRQNDLNPSLLLSVARAKHPNDFELAFALGRWYILHIKDGRQIGPLEAARALRPDNSTIWNNLGLALDSRREYDLAVIACREAIRLNPNFAQYHSNLGVVLTNAGDLAEAIAECREAVKLDPSFAIAHNNLAASLQLKGERDAKWATAHRNLGVTLLARGELAAAIAGYKKAIELDPLDAEPHTNLGNVLLGQGDLSGAIAKYTEALRLDPNYVQAHVNRGTAFRRKADIGDGSNLVTTFRRKGELAVAIAAYREAIQRDPTFAIAHYNLGETLFTSGDIDGAIAAYWEAIRLDPKDAAAFNGLGVGLRMRGDLPGSIAACKEAIKLDPQLALAHNNLGIALADQGKLESAIAAYKEAIRLDQKYAQAHYNLGVALAAKGDLRSAVSAYQTAIKLDRQYVQAFNNLGNALADLGDRDGAIAAFKETIRLNPKHTKAHLNLGSVLFEKGDVAGAIAAYKEAIKLDSKLAPVHYNLAMALEAKGDQDGAIAEYKQAIKLDPKYAQPHINLGNVFLSQGKVDAAIVEYKQAIKLDPKFPQPHTNLGAIALQLKKYDEAISHARAAIKADPNYPNAHALLGLALQQTGDLAGARAALTTAARLDRRFAGLLAQLPPIPVAPPPHEVKR